VDFSLFVGEVDVEDFVGAPGHLEGDLFLGGKIGASPPTFSPLFSLKNRLKNGAFPFIFGTFEQKKTAKRPKKRSIPVH
jgi:hypothetical protein